MEPGGQGAVERRGAIDVARSASLILVVVAHLVMVVLDRDPDGALRGINLFELYPGLEWLTLLSPMPLFFVASGWANVGGSVASRLGRTRTLVTLATVLTVCWSVAALVERAASGDNGIVADGARIATQPMWFLTAWVPFTMAAPFMNRCARRIVPVVCVCLGTLALIDIARFRFDAPRWIGYPGFFLAWSVPWIAGAWWRQRNDRARRDEQGVGDRNRDELRIGAGVAAASILVAVPLVGLLGYHAALIDAVPGNRSNTTPPTLFTAVASLVQVGLFMMGARWLDSVAVRRARVIRSLNQVAPGLYVWHLTSLTLWGALLAAGLWAPGRLSWQWWLTRPLWFALVVVGALGFSLASRAALTRAFRGSDSAPARRPAGTMILVVATVSAVLAFGLTGLYGPDTSGMAISISLLCLVASMGFGSRRRGAAGVLS